MSTTISRTEFDILASRLASLEDQIQTVQKTILGRGIEKTPNICGGSARIVRTRIPVWTLEAYRRNGTSESSILDSFPTLTASDLVNAWAYVASNPKEIESDILSNEDG